MRKRNLLLTLVALSLATTNLWAGVADIADDGKLPGAFSVSATKQVYFSQGNLQYIGSASTPYWKFANEQYEFLGTTTGQNSAATNVDRDLFGWATSGHNSKYPYMTSTTASDYGPSIYSGAWTSNSIYWDWGVKNSSDLGDGWRTLTDSEWYWLFNSRKPVNSVNGTSKARYTEARILTDGTAPAKDICGIILFPDDATLTTVSGVTWGPINSTSKFDGSSPACTTCTTEGWEALEAAGCVFLPAAGDRYGTSLNYVGTYGFYHSSSSSSDMGTYCMYFCSSNLTLGYQSLRSNAYSVRLVSEIAPLPAASITSIPTAKTGLTYSLNTPQTLINAGTAEGGTMLYSLDGTNWSEELPQGLNATTYTVYYKVQGDGVTHKDYTPSPNTFNVTISPANIVMPTIETDLIYDGTPQPLLDITGIVGGTIKYSVDGNEPWLDVCPSETEIGTYDIWYKVDAANANYNSIPATKVTVTIDDPYPFVADNADPSTTLTSLLNTPSDLKVKRTIYADDEYNTICLPFALDESALAASPLAGFNRLKTFKGAQVTGTAPDLYIDIFVEDATEIQAGVPYLITYPSAHADIVDPVFHGITVTTTEPSATSADGVTFQGMFAQVHINPYTADREQDYLFLGANSQLMWPSSDQTSSSIKMRGFRAYFIIDRNSITPALAPKGTRARILDAPKTTTAIDNTSAKFGGSEKIIENGILYIIRNGVKYNAQGQVIK